MRVSHPFWSFCKTQPISFYVHLATLACATIRAVWWGKSFDKPQQQKSIIYILPMFHSSRLSKDTNLPPPMPLLLGTSQGSYRHLWDSGHRGHGHTAGFWAISIHLKHSRLMVLWPQRLRAQAIWSDMKGFLAFKSKTVKYTSTSTHLLSIPVHPYEYFVQIPTARCWRRLWRTRTQETT